MFFLNLTAGEFFTIFALVGGLVTSLYLLDRAKRKRVVSTLRFWTSAISAEERHSRKRMREPWSLALQLLSLLLLLLAIAGLHWGPRERSGTNHVLLLDTSSWTAQRAGPGTLLDREKALVRRYIATLPSHDRMMLVRVDGLSVPATSFTSDRAQLFNALLQSTPGFSALNIEQALSFARHAQTSAQGRPGEIVYIGPELIADDASLTPQLPNLRVIAVRANRDHCGIRRLGVKRNEEDVNAWQAIVTVKNYGWKTKTVRVRTQFAGTVFAPRSITLEPGREHAVEYNFTTNTAGQLIAGLSPSDSLDSDHRAVLDLPRAGPLKLAAFTARPEILKPLLESDRRLRVTFSPSAAYVPQPAADVVLLDQFAPQVQPKTASLWIGPFNGRSPLPLKSVVNNRVVTAWHSENPLATGLHARSTQISTADVFQVFDGDLPVASVPEGPVVVARPQNQGRPKMAAIGFDPLDRQLKFEVTTPLLFANLLRWLTPEAVRASELAAAPVGAASVTLEPGEHAASISATEEGGAPVPFTIRQRTVQLFARRPRILHLTSSDRERVLSFTLPEVADFEWKPPANAASGLPAHSPFAPEPIDPWKWLASLAGCALLTEWILYGRERRHSFRNRPPVSPSVRTAAQRESELISK